MNKKIILSILLSLSFWGMWAQNSLPCFGTVEYHSGSDLLLKEYKDNQKILASLVSWLKNDYLENAPNSHIHMVAYYNDNTPEAINKASIRASTLRAYLRTYGSKELRYTFSLQHSYAAYRIDVYCNPHAADPTAYTTIHFTESNDRALLQRSVGRYPASVYSPYIPLNDIPGRSLSAEADSIAATSRMEAIYFRWDKHNLDQQYMGNDQTLSRIGRMLSNVILQTRMDSIVVTATASPEGNVHYNQRLSERRLNTMLNYLTDNFPAIDTEKYRPFALGEDWEGFYTMVEEDFNVPYREDVLRIAMLPIPNDEKERWIRRLGGGVTYKYIVKNILRYLRTGATCVLFYPKQFDELIRMDPMEIYKGLGIVFPDIKPRMVPVVIPEPDYRYIRPIAVKTNLLFDAATLFNIELEAPLGKKFSVLAEWTFPFWGGLGNDGGVAPLPAYSEKYTFQMLSGGLEARYWFPRSKSLDEWAQNWLDYNPLNGWFVGLYGGAGLYDFQWKGKGMQGEFYIASGISAGYAHPITKYFHMEYSVGVGYLATRYYKYTGMGGHKVVDIRSNGQYDRRQQSLLGPTKLKISLVWIPRFKVNSKKGESCK